MNVRRASQGDVSAIIRMGLAFIESVPALSRVGIDEPATRALIERLVSSDDAAIFVVESGGDPFGMLAIVSYEYYFNPEFTMSQELFWWVDEEHRNSGCASEMLSAAESWSRSRGVRAMQMISLDESDGDAVSAMYVRRGYVPLERSYVKEI